MKPLILLELNEISFEYVEAYIARGELPHLGSLIRRHGYSETTSEDNYEELEPWIQWVTAHTGLAFWGHGVFRLGDIVHNEFPQLWELLEAGGLKVGAVSPMNAANRLQDPAFFLPDPWTDTPASGSWLLRELGRAISQAVNDNTKGRVSLRSALILLISAFRYAYPSRYAAYLRDSLTSRGRPWRRALVLDRLVANVFEREWCRYRPDFSSVFLNGVAFVQHHYMFSSAVYGGRQRNPEWYVSARMDPMLEAYRLYDDILGRMMRYGARMMIATALHQIPYGQTTYYWRLRDHERTLRKWGVPFRKIQPRMSRDFLVVCHDEIEAEAAAACLRSATADGGEPLFEVDLRDGDLFVMLIYPRDVGKGFRVRVGQRWYDDFAKDVAFVAIKNGHHHGVGYFLDTGEHADERPASFPLAQLKDRVMKARGFGVETGAPRRERHRRARSLVGVRWS